MIVQAPPDRLPREGESMFRSTRPDYQINPGTGCWEWLKALTPNGYPIGGNMETWGTCKAHRIYYERAHGSAAKGWHVHHTCQNTSCVNPGHLELLEPDQHFHEHWIAGKGLDVADLLEIRRLGTVPGVRPETVAYAFGIHVETVKGHWRGEHWVEIAGGPAVLRSWPCVAPDCDKPVMGPRHKRYCSLRCRSRTNDRRQRSGIVNPYGSNGRYFDPEMAPMEDKR